MNRYRLLIIVLLCVWSNMHYAQSWELSQTVLKYDHSNNRPETIWNRGWSLPIELSYSSSGKVTQFKVGIQEKHFVYKSNNNLIESIAEIDSTITTFQYDSYQRLRNTTNSLGVNTRFIYHFGYGNIEDNFIKTRSFFPTFGNYTNHYRTEVVYSDGFGNSVQNIKLNHSPTFQDVATVQKYDSRRKLIAHFEPFVSSAGNGDYASIPSQAEQTSFFYEDAPTGRFNGKRAPSWHKQSTLFSCNMENEVYDYANASFYPPASLYKMIDSDSSGKIHIEYKDKIGNLVKTTILDSINQDTSSIHYIYNAKQELIQKLPPGTTPNDLSQIYFYDYDGRGNLISQKWPDKGFCQYRYNSRNLMTWKKEGANTWLKYVYDNYGRLISMWWDDPGSGPLQRPPNFPNLPFPTLLHSIQYDGNNIQSRGKLTYERILVPVEGLYLKKYYQYDNHGRLIRNNASSLLFPNDTSSIVEAFEYDAANHILSNSNAIRINANEVLHQNYINLYDHAGRLSRVLLNINQGQSPREIAHIVYTHKDEIASLKLGRVPNSYLQEINYQYLPNGLLSQINQLPLLSKTWTSDQMPCNDVSSSQPPSGIPDIYYLKLDYNLQTFATNNFVPQFNGNIAQMSWKTPNSSRFAYDFKYDFLNRMTHAHFKERWHNGIEQDSIYDVYVKYKDELGNISSISRNGRVNRDDACATASLIDQLGFDYYPNSNRLRTVNDSAEATVANYGYKPSPQNSIYLYDHHGSMIYDPSIGLRKVNNYLHLADSLIFDDGRIIVNYYDVTGKKHHTAKYLDSEKLFESRHYLLNAEVTDSSWKSIYHAYGRVLNKTSTQRLYLDDTLSNVEMDYYADVITANTVIKDSSKIRFWYRDSTELRDRFEVENSSTFELDVDPLPRQYDLSWEYFIKDHLGNVRLVFADKNADGTIQVTDSLDSEILEEYHYYPFGMEMHVPTITLRSDLANENSYRYGNKEQDPWSNYIDFVVRSYSPSLGRWHQIDPLADQFENWSPYSYTLNNPLRFNDPTGMAPEWYIDELGQDTYDRQGWVDNSAEMGPDDYIFNILNDDGSKTEIGRIVTGDENHVEFNIDRKTAEKYGLDQIDQIKEDLPEEAPKDFQAVSMDISVEIAKGFGGQVELSLIGMIDGNEKGEWGISGQGNVIYGNEGGATGSISVYSPVQNGGSLRLRDLSGWEFGSQGSILHQAIGFFSGFEGFTRSYNGYSYGLSFGQNAFVPSGSGYLGYSSFLITSFDLKPRP